MTRSRSTCTLCGLETPEPPITAPEVQGGFCCRGCLEVARTLDDTETGSPEPRHSLDVGPDDATGETAFLTVEGMHCTTCEAFLEARVTDHPGVQAASASYPNGMLRVVYDQERLTEDDLSDIVGGVGYMAREREMDDTTDRPTIGRLLVGGFFGMMTMCWYVLFLYPTYAGLPAVESLLDLAGLAGSYVLLNVWVMATIVLGYTGWPVLRGAYVSLLARRPNMDLLVALAACTAYLYSVVVLLLGGREVYFDVTVVIVLAVTAGRYYEERVREGAAGTLTELTKERVNTARRRTAAGIEEVPISELKEGDELVVRASERIPVDGTVVEGTAGVDESLLTGESNPVRVSPGDEVIGGGLLTDGGIVIEATDGSSSTLERVVETLWTVQSERSGAQRLADRLAAVFVPLVLLLSLIVGAVHWVLGAPPSAVVLTSLAVLVVSCPCALGLATPLAITAGVKTALEEGIVFTNDGLFERAPRTATVAFDKTGTLTTGEMQMSKWIGEEEGLKRAAAVEQFADHPLAEAITDRVTSPELPVSDFERYPGRGVGATVEGERVIVGRRDLFNDEGWHVPSRFAKAYREARTEGDIPALVGWNGRARGTLAVGDTPRPGWEEVLQTLAGRRIVIITGDDEDAATQFSDHPAVDEVFAGVPPEAKAEVIQRLRADGPVAMVGDGSNDAPGLAIADAGIAMEEGTQLAADAADAVVTDSDLHAVPRVFETATATRRRIRENITWAFCYNAVALPLAATGVLNPLFAAVAMAASSLLVVGNSMRSLGTERPADRSNTGPTTREDVRSTRHRVGS